MFDVEITVGERHQALARNNTSKRLKNIGDCAVPDLQIIEFGRFARNPRLRVEKSPAICRDPPFRAEVGTCAKECEQSPQGPFKESLGGQRVPAGICGWIKCSVHQPPGPAQGVTVPVRRHIKRQQTACFCIEHKKDAV